MSHAFADIAFTDAVKRLQTENGSRRAYERFEAAVETKGEPAAKRNLAFGEAETVFVGARDSFYLATVNADGWPYIQHRGGPPGFVRVLDPNTLGFADFRGNRQYVSVGNLGGDDRVSLFFMDYAHRRRLKVFGRARVVEAPSIVDSLAVADYHARVERGIVITIAGFDWNCPQHITARFTTDEVEAAIAPLRRRIAELEGLTTGMN